MSERSEMDIVRHYGSRPPVDVIGLIRELGIEYTEEPMPHGDSGRIVRSGGKYSIYVNKAELPQRKRFTAAHELGHYLMHSDLLDERGHLDRLFNEAAQRNPDAPLEYRHEAQANKFAAGLLMPSGLIFTYYNRNSDNFAELAGKFGVSRMAMKIRLASLGLRTLD